MWWRARHADGLPALAQAAYPSRTVKMIVPYPAGGTTDFLGRWLPMGSRPPWRHVIVENKPGAGTTLARTRWQGPSPMAIRC